MFDDSILHSRLPQGWPSGADPEGWKSLRVEELSSNNNPPFCWICVQTTSSVKTPFTKTLISTSQHGFTAGKFTVTNVLLFENFILSAFNKGLQLDVAFFNFPKAFVQVDHAIILSPGRIYRRVYLPSITYLPTKLQVNQTSSGL